MSKKRRARKGVKNVHSRDPALALALVLQFLVSLLFDKPFSFICSVFNSVASVILMMVGKRELPDPGVHEKKRARLLNKQNKVIAMYRLVNGETVPTTQGKRLGEEDFKQMKKELAERKRELAQLPRFNVNSGNGAGASVYSTPYDRRTPILLSDIEHLVTYAYGGNSLVIPPSRWCGLYKPNKLNNVVVLAVSGVGLSEFVDHEECFSGMMGIFGGSDNSNRGILEFLSPEWYGGTLASEVKEWGVVSGLKEKSTPQPEAAEFKEPEPEKQSPAAEAPEEPQDSNYDRVISQLSSVFPITGKVKKRKRTVPPGDAFSRTDLVLTLPQLIQENYPLPIPSNTCSKIKFVATAESYAPLNPHSKIFAIDCEMCCTAEDPQALTKIAVIDEELNTVYESLVKPDQEITDYLTRWSGITKEMLQGVTTKLADVQERVRGIVAENPDCVFVGQSLNCDLKAIRMTHPYVIDTSCIFNLTGIEGRKSSLRDLSYNLLDHQIQDRRVVGHCPVEDAGAAMRLVKAKLKEGFHFGNAIQNPYYKLKSTKLAIDNTIFGNSFKQSKLDKNVLLAYQPQNPSVPEQPPKSSGYPIVTHRITSSNSDTVKTVSVNIYEHFLSIGFYSVHVDSENYTKSLEELDRRVARLYENLNGNTLFLVLCCRDQGGCGKGEGEAGRKNNGVVFARCKVPEVKKVRRD